MEKYNLKVQDIADAITANNKSTGGNFIRIGSSQMNNQGYTVHDNKFRSVFEL